jgi:murein L,D-transpeptidase YafK
MRRVLLKVMMLVSLLVFVNGSVKKPQFLTEQKNHPRVKQAIKKKESLVRERLKNHYINLDDFNLLMVAYKAEKRLDIFAKKPHERRYIKIISYPICDISGKMGPKRKRGDLQTPEGFYHIDRFNPGSSYHLSFRVNYPNLADRRKSPYSDLGGDIYVHGSCATIGCLPMTDELIEEIYIMAIYAMNSQEKIPVYIFPFEMNNDNFYKYSHLYSAKKDLIDFWKNLKLGWDLFNVNNRELKFDIDKTGDYQFLFLENTFNDM